MRSHWGGCIGRRSGDFHYYKGWTSAELQCADEDGQNALQENVQAEEELERERKG